jgi:hypothetical protein
VALAKPTCILRGVGSLKFQTTVDFIVRTPVLFYSLIAFLVFRCSSDVHSLGRFPTRYRGIRLCECPR